MNLTNRRRLLTLARFLDRIALRIRARVKAATPKRTRKASAVRLVKDDCA